MDEQFRMMHLDNLPSENPIPLQPCEVAISGKTSILSLQHGEFLIYMMISHSEILLKLRF